MRHPDRIWTAAVCVAAFIVTATTLVQAQVPDTDLSTASSAAGGIYIFPDGNGETLAGVGAIVTVTLRDANNDPVVGYPKENIWIESANPGELAFCTGGNIADANTDALGVTTFSGSFAGGGCTQGGLQVVVDGVPLASSPLEIDVNSPDINGDLRVDLCDLGPFAASFHGAYSFCADYQHNGMINVADIIALAQGYCAACPEGTPPTVTASGEIGLFFDADGTRTGVLGVASDSYLDMYVIAFEAPGGIKAFEFEVSCDENVYVLFESMILPPGFQAIQIGTSQSVNAVSLGDCLEVSGPTVLAQFRLFVTADLNESPVCLGPSGISCTVGLTGPAYISCLDSCDWRQFYPAYSGCAYVNGMGPIAGETTTWGQLKALFR